MPANPATHVRILSGLLACALVAACDGIVGAELECSKICITSVGPTLPGTSVPGDAGAPPDGLASRPASMEFFVPLQQLSDTLAGVDVEARITSLKLMAPADLAFVDSVQVVLRAGVPDGGVRPTDAAPPPATAPDAAVTAPPPAAAIDAGPSSILIDDLPGIKTSMCLASGPGLPVATYRKPASATGTVGKSLDLQATTGEANVYPCLRGAPAKFALALDVLPTALPATDTPVSLKVCISARASASYP
jgi:hypothetical protein